jgi:serine/threonine-protein kinase RsbW
MPSPDNAQFDGAKLLLRFEVEIPGKVDAISPVVDQVMELLGSMGCGQGKEFAIETALRESLANAVVHGCKQDPSKQVQCSVYCDENGAILIVVRDPGPGFDPQSLPSPTQGQHIFSEHGRGVYLINQLMDDGEYQQGGTEIYMRKH